jgi:carboxyl-terminal processing protease
VPPESPPEPHPAPPASPLAPPQIGATGHGRPARADTRRAAKLFRRGAAIVFRVLLIVIVFVIGNLAAYFGIVNIGRLVGLGGPTTVGAPSPNDEVSAVQLASRLDEVAALLDADSLYRYTQGDLDAATTEAIRSLIETSNDPYAYYYEPEEYAEYLRGSEGEYSGIGVVLAMLDDRVTVLQVYEGSPASDAGVVPGDVLVAIDGDRHDWELQEATDTIRRLGVEGVTVIWQRGDDERQTDLVMREVNIPTVVSHLIERDGQPIGYAYLRRFSARSASELSEAIKSLEDRGAQACVLDLRGNPGGYLSQAIDITSLFVDEGAVVRIEDRRGVTVERVTGGAITSKPLVVLVNGGSASASELVTAALRDHDRALIVGEPTYGKGTVQDVRVLSWGGAIKYTIAHYMSPNGTVLDGVGITPDLLVELPEESGSVGLSNHITSDGYRYEQGVDPQLDAALQALLNALAGKEAAKDDPS